MRHALEVAGVDLDHIFPEQPLLPLDPSREERKIHHTNGQSFAYIVNADNETVRWDTLTPSRHLRLILSPDEGGPLFCGFQYLASRNGCVGFNRDPLQLFRTG